MGPEGINLSRNPLQFSDRVPPSFDGYEDYQQYRENLLLWEAMTSIAPEKRAPTAIGQLTGQAQITAKTLSLAIVISDTGLPKLVQELDKKFGMDETALLHNNVANFFDFIWEKQMPVEEFVVGFHSRLDRITKLNMNDELKGHLLLRQANLDSHDRNLIVGAAGGDYSLQSLSTSLRNAYRSEGLPPTSMTMQAPDRRHVRPDTSSRTRTSVPSTSRTSNPTGKINDTPLYYTFISSSRRSDQIAAIIDSGACASVVGKDTLDRAMRELSINEIEDEKIHQKEHQFGPYDKPRKSLCAVCVPFSCKSTIDNKDVRFRIRFDVIEGDLPFLIGLPSLRAMGATLNFRHCNLSLAIDKVIYRIDLIEQSSHLCLPLQSKSRYCRALGSEQTAQCHLISNRMTLKEDPRHYYTPSNSTQEKNQDQSMAATDQTHPIVNHEEPAEQSPQSPTSISAVGSRKPNLTPNQLQKIHRQLGHGTYNQVRDFIREAREWKEEYSDPIKKIIESCACSLVNKPVAETGRSSESVPQSPPETTPPEQSRIRRRESVRLAKESRKITQGLPEKRRTTHQTSFQPTQVKRTELNELPSVITASEKANAYELEKKGWETAGAYVHVAAVHVPRSSNIIGSHVIYKRKPTGCVKARIVPWGHRDSEKDNVRGDAHLADALTKDNQIMARLLHEVLKTGQHHYPAESFIVAADAPAPSNPRDYDSLGNVEDDHHNNTQSGPPVSRLDSSN